jgi:hypothetical protein
MMYSPDFKCVWASTPESAVDVRPRPALNQKRPFEQIDFIGSQVLGSSGDALTWSLFCFEPFLCEL